MRDATISVVIPAKNEARNLPHVLPLVPADVHEVILVDGDSTDDTIEVARSIRPDIRVVAQIGRGKGAALRTGFAAATGDIIVMLDADGSTDPREIPAFVARLHEGADLVKGSRFLAGGGTSDMEFHRKLGNWGFVMMFRVLYGEKFSDLCYGYNAFWRRVLPALDLDCDGFEIETLIATRAARAGLRIAEVPSFESPRIHGVSNLHAVRDGMRVLRTLLSERVRPMPVHLVHEDDRAVTAFSGPVAVAATTTLDEPLTAPVSAEPMLAATALAPQPVAIAD